MSRGGDDGEETRNDAGGVRRRTFVKGTGALSTGSLLMGLGEAAPGAGMETAAASNQSDVRSFDVHAVEVDIVYNAFDLHQPNGAMYVLEENLDAVREASGVTPDDGFSLIDGTDPREGVDTSVIQPLTIRANRGQTVEITFTNHLDRPASIHQTSLPYDVERSDGMAVGFNPSTVAQPGETVTYRWQAVSEGGKFFYDGANQAVATADAPPQEANLLSRGLFGMLVVEPPGTSWTDPETGDPLRSGVRADIHGPIGPQVGDSHYREFVIHYHTPEGLTPDLTWPGTDTPQTVHAINYRADPTGQRVNDDCADCDLEKGFYNSWTNGDPGGGDNVYETYVGDPVKFVFTSASGEENHVHHLHNHRWKQVPRTGADTIDAQTIGLGETFESYLVAGHGPGSTRPNMTFAQAFEVGAGYVHGNAGDVLFHCHLFPHYGEGMWGFMRVHDKRRPWLAELPNTGDLLAADSPLGFPEFVPGERGRLPPDEPALDEPTIAAGAESAREASEEDARGPTPTERAALGDIVPGAPYSDPCVDANRTIKYTLRAMSTDIVYNDAGEHDPDGQFYILEEATIDGETHQVTDPEAVRNGELNPEPLFIRANVGDCIEFTLVNELDHDVSMHQHFVGYDLLGSDSLATGYNYTQETAANGGRNQYRWFADEEGTIFFHDHIVGLGEVMHGQFAGLIVEPEGSEWRDPYSGDPVYSGAQAIIDPPSGESFREQCLHLHDFAQLRDRQGRFINQDREHNQNAGTMAINYRNAPYYTRNDPDPAYVHSSAVHGDPETPVLEAYEDDTIRFRVFQGAYEEQHNFGLHGLRIDPEGFDPQDSVSEVIGTSEAFTYTVPPESEQFPFDKLDNPDGLPVRDYRYGSSIVDDLWCGMWGLVRVWGERVDHLRSLPGSSPGGSISETDLREMGHPAVYSDLDWTDLGQEAKLRYGSGDDTSRPADRDARQNSAVGNVPPAHPGPGNPAPDDREPDRVYDVAAVSTQLRYDDYGDRDPHGVAFVASVYANQVRNGVRELVPLTIRANEGELVEVRVTNELQNLNDNHPDPEMRIERPWERSERISLHPQRIAYDVNGSDGATVGFNYDQTADRGETVTYRWYTDEPLGTTVLWDFADVRSNRHHGSFGQLVIEPEESVVLTNDTAEPIPTDPECMVTNPRGGRLPDFRENALLFADGQYVVNGGPNRNCVVPPGEEDDDGPCTQIGDSEDHGYFGINYRAEPFVRRFENGPDDPHLVYSSEVHGDPATPVLRALLDDPVTFRVGQAADKGRAIAFHLSGHQWARYQGVAVSADTGVNSQLSVGKAAAYDLVGGAGNTTNSVGDYVYQETKQVRRLEGGLWGIFRVREEPDDFDEPVQPLPDRARGRPGGGGGGGGSPEDSPLVFRPGYVVRVANVTGGPQPDTIVGVPDSDLGAPDGGAVYVFFDTPPGQVRDLLDPDLQIPSELAGDRIGQRISVQTRANQSFVFVEGNSGTYGIGIDGRLVEIAENPPETPLAEFVRGATNSAVRATVPVQAVDAWQNPGRGSGGDGPPGQEDNPGNGNPGNGRGQN
ncbi:multicopper oxidase domain-containing protein [Halomarina litorea]|uniref:multicopper oxidase domain-containing protein n=1 Tax=Halomarina litorea TaxID=2961595 RepID=UPI0020C44C7C|nr:multicopper oxidase domain-containing protein [Halomarina sp. BCD28]